MKKFMVLILISTLTFYLFGCSKKEEKNRLIIAEQYGLAYAPIQIMKEKGYLEELLPDTKIEWVTLPNTTAVREAMLSNRLDVGFIGIPPFLIGFDHGMDWKVMYGLSKNPSGLVSYDERLKTLSDFTDGDKIAVPQPGSIQHILLSMACEKQFKDAKKVDNLLVTMSHPDGYQALTAKSTIKAHFTSPPYFFDELKNDENHLILSGEEAFGGEFTFIVGVCRGKFHTNKKQYQALQEGLEQAMEFIRLEKEETIKLLSKSYSIDPEILKGYLEQEGMEYNKEVIGLERFTEFMYENEYIQNNYSVDDLLWE